MSNERKKFWMEILQLPIDSKNLLVKDYINNQNESLFHYSFHSEEDWKLRYTELMGRVFPRKQLTNYIRNFMKSYSITDEIEQSLVKLEDEKSVVVIGGQQAGLLTGPLYSIHKMISIVLLAKEKEKELGVPVVPVFWIAGEDHDIQEVNHVYYSNGEKLVKSVFHQKWMSDKQMVSKIQLDKDRLKSWYENIVASFGETEHSRIIIQFLNNCLSESTTFTQFFTSITNELFKHYGLLLVDSADSELRKIERDFFQTLIHSGQDITKRLLSQQNELRNQGYTTIIETQETSLQLFLEVNGERFLLHHDEETNSVKGRNSLFSYEDLSLKLESNPELFSNNVVTRPLMQEYLFPTLAFIAGPGEISYWAELKQCFEMFNIKLPIIIPRLNITLLERDIEADMKSLSLSLEKVLTSGVSTEKNLKVKELLDSDLEQFIIKKKQEILERYEEVIKKVEQFDKGLEPIVKKNAQFIISQLNYLERKVEASVKSKHEVLLKKYDQIELSLFPLNGLQERCWNIFYFLNQYGFSLIDDLLQLPYQFNGSHYVVKI